MAQQSVSLTIEQRWFIFRRFRCCRFFSFDTKITIHLCVTFSSHSHIFFMISPNLDSVPLFVSYLVELFTLKEEQCPFISTIVTKDRDIECIKDGRLFINRFINTSCWCKIAFGLECDVCLEVVQHVRFNSVLFSTLAFCLSSQSGFIINEAEWIYAKLIIC